MDGAARFHDRIVFTFDWRKAKAEPMIGMAKANSAVTDAANGIVAKLESLSSDVNFTQVGRQTQLREWFHTHGVQALLSARKALDAADDAIDAIKATLRTASIDARDFAGAVVRSDLRRWFRDLPDARRNAMLVVDNFDPALALALTESIPELAGLSPEQHARLAERSIAALNPEKGKQIAEIEAGAAALASTVNAATAVMAKAAGMGTDEVDAALGLPSLSTRIAAGLEALS